MTTEERKRLFALREAIVSLAEATTNEAIYEYAELYNKWRPDGVAYEVGQKVAFEGDVYKVLQAHVSQETWNPKDAPSLFAKVLNPDPEVIPDWEQPGSTNPYMKGDKVRHVEKIWVSLVDNNVWEPGAVGTESLWAEAE